MLQSLLIRHGCAKPHVATPERRHAKSITLIMPVPCNIDCIPQPPWGDPGIARKNYMYLQCRIRYWCVNVQLIDMHVSSGCRAT